MAIGDWLYDSFALNQYARSVFTEADNQLLADIFAPPTPQRSTTPMRISLQPNDPAPRLASAKAWLTRILSTPTLSGVDLPRDIKGYIYINDVPHQLARGAWVIGDGLCYIGNTNENVDPLTRLAVLTCIANMTGAIADPAIVALIEGKLVSTISDSVCSVYHGFMRSTVNPSRLAIDQFNNRIAAELNGGWYLTSGAPVEVDNTWIVMDF